jgi:DNA polymerase III subunit epsilon
MSGGRPQAPLRRARSAPWTQVEWVSLDFEATGLDPSIDRVISFGVVPIRGGRAIVRESVRRLVDPGEVRSTESAVRVHGLLATELRQGVSPEVAKEELGRALGHRFILAWYAPVEVGFLRGLYGARRGWWENRTLDVRDLVIAMMGRGAERMSLSTAAGVFGVPVADPHDALDDALVTAQLFLVTASKLAGSQATFKQMKSHPWLATAGARAAQEI